MRRKDWTKRPRKRRIFVKGGRYDPWELGRRIENRRRDMDVPVLELCTILDCDKADWSRKWRVKGSTFTIAEISVIAEHLRAPVGWPFIPEELALVLERLPQLKAAAGATQ